MIKRILVVLFIYSILNSWAYAASKWGYGELKLSDRVIDAFVQYIKARSNKSPHLFAVSLDGLEYNYYTCSAGYNQCAGGDEFIIEECNKFSRDYGSGAECKLFARQRTIKWDNGKSKNTILKSKMSADEIKDKLTQIGLIGGASINTEENLTSSSSETVKKKEVKKYELAGERSIALSWDGYADLIAGTIKFSEADYKGTLSIPLPNNDGNCDGTYSLQEGGKGTWQIACTNNMGAAGTLKWIKDGGVTGSGRDYNDKKVKFTVSKQG